MNPPLKFVAIAFSDYSSIGFEFYSTVVKPYFDELREKEEAGGGSGSDARKKKSEFRGLPAERQHHDSQG